MPESIEEQSNSVLRCQNLTKGYRQGHSRLEVLRGVSLDLTKGERLAIIGASGSGKSTLLNLMGGLDVPDEGETRLLGSAFSAEKEHLRGRLRNRHLGFVYQFHHLLGEFSARENVAIPAMIWGHKRSEALALADDWLSKVGLSERLEHKPSELSGGERQRVAIARALVNQPACVLMDEPTGNLDRQTAESVEQLLKNLSEQVSTAFVIVTHDERLAATADRTCELRDGLLV